MDFAQDFNLVDFSLKSLLVKSSYGLKKYLTIFKMC